MESFVLTGIEKPVTLVHAFRLAEAFGAEIVLLQSVKPPQPVLSEMFPRWVAVRTTVCEGIDELRAYLTSRGQRCVALEVTRTAVPYWEFRPAANEPLAIIIGSESSGVRDEFLTEFRDHLFIPMVGQATCLSAGMALSIVAAHFAWVDQTDVSTHAPRP